MVLESISVVCDANEGRCSFPSPVSCIGIWKQINIEEKHCSSFLIYFVSNIRVFKIKMFKDQDS